MANTAPTSFLSRLGLNRPELRAWAMYDWANSAFMTTIIAAVFPVYYSSVAAVDLPAEVRLTRFSLATTIALAIVAVISPLLGAVADYAGIKKKMLATFLAIGVLATADMYFIGRGEWLFALVLFVVGNIGVSGSFVFYDSLLPHIARHDELDRVSSAGSALGYMGGGLLLAINTLWLLKPAMFGLSGEESAARLSFLSVAVWWVGFSIPLFRKVPEPPRQLEPDEDIRASAWLVAFGRVGETFRELRVFKNAFIMLIAFLIYNDGINTIIRMAAVYGETLGIPRQHLIAAILLVQFVGIPFAFLFGDLAGRIGAKRSVFLALIVYTGISIVAYSMRSVWQFYLLAFLVATVQGGSQALSRSLFAGMIPRHKSSEFFGFFGVFEKFAGIIGPALFAAVTAATGSGRGAILSVIAFFAVGGGFLALVNVPEGQKAAQEADAKARPT
ncbi:MAG: MFS transporter [Acidobacteria bacterium]|nr:MFS transporter [Acidobacteriota bacterium]